MRRSYFFLIVIAAGIVAVLTVLFFVFDNPYRRLNPEPTPTVQDPSFDDQLPPFAAEAKDTSLISVWGSPTLGMTTGVDGLRLVFYDQSESKIAVTEFDGTGYQELSETLLGVDAIAVSPTKEKAWMRLIDPESNDAVTLVYDFRAKEAVRLENGIKSIDWSPDGSELLYYVERDGSAPALKIVSANGVEPRTIRDGFSVQNPVLDWYAEAQLAYWLPPSSTRPSSIITMSTTGDNAVELSTEALAQQALFSPDGKFVLVGQNNPDTGKPRLLLGSTVDRELAPLALTTWLDKCTWMADSGRILCFVPRDLPGGFTYPDDDNGKHVYRDQLWVIDAATAKPQLIYDIPGSIPDATRPFAAHNGSRLNFLSRISGTIISLDIADMLVAPTTPDQSADETDQSNIDNSSAADNTTNSTVAPANTSNNSINTPY